LLKKGDQDIAIISDIIFTVSESIKNKYVNMGHNSKTFLLPNACDVGHFGKALKEETKINIEIASLKKPIIGYIGHINQVLDNKLLYDIAIKRPKWNFVLIGLVNGKTDKYWDYLLKMNNVYYLGFKNYSNLPEYSKGFDVAILPWIIDKYTKSVDPNKAVQYLAAGKKVVSTPIPALNRLPLITIAKNATEFVDAIDKYLIYSPGENQAYVKKAKYLSNENSIEVRAKQRIDIINTLQNA